MRHDRSRRAEVKCGPRTGPAMQARLLYSDPFRGFPDLREAATMARPRDEGATLMMIRRAREWVLLACTATFAQPAPPVAKADAGPHYDVLISGGTVYDGSGGAPFVGDVAI